MSEENKTVWKVLLFGLLGWVALFFLFSDEDPITFYPDDYDSYYEDNYEDEYLEVLSDYEDLQYELDSVSDELDELRNCVEDYFYDDYTLAKDLWYYCL